MNISFDGKVMLFEDFRGNLTVFYLDRKTIVKIIHKMKEIDGEISGGK